MSIKGNGAEGVLQNEPSIKFRITPDGAVVSSVGFNCLILCAYVLRQLGQTFCQYFAYASIF